MGWIEICDLQDEAGCTLTKQPGRPIFIVNIMNGVGWGWESTPFSEASGSPAELASSEGRQPGARYNLRG